ncbi:MAG: N-acetylmuramoyl-L-alanine amidase [Lachnospiraceae bacterium]|jgi:glucan-binding YG repeat protein/N-acetylmuramoyl-L-alanine amidase
MKKWKKQAVSLLLTVIMMLSAAMPVMAQPEEAEGIGRSADAEYILVSEDTETGVQSVFVSVDMEGSLSEAVLTYQDGAEEQQALAAMTAENCMRFDLALPAEGAERVFLTVTGVSEGENITVDLMPAEDGDTVAVESETVVEAVEEEADTVQESSDLQMPQELENSVIRVDESITGADVAEAVNAIAQQSDEIAAVQETEKNEKLRGAKQYIVVLDPGHGNKDSGTTFTYDGVLYKEAELVLKIANYAKAELEKQGNIKVYMTRYKDTDFRGLSDRVNYAKSVNADILVSLHINSVGASNPPQATTAHGVVMLVPRTGRYHSEVAENAQDLASDILKKLVALGLYNRGFYERDSESNPPSTYPDGSTADYYGIVRHSLKAGLPGIIVEHGFLNNAGDFKLAFSSEAKLKALGVADAQGIIEFLKDYTPADFWDWKKTDGKWYYVNQNGEKATGWILHGTGWYYLDKNGVMLTGLQTIDGKLYYLYSSGCMLTGWQYVNNKWYYFGADGAAFKNKWYDGYYLGADGVWIEDYKPDTGNGNDTSTTINGWKLEKDVWYYYVKGKKQTDWQLVGGKWYYMNKSGAMQTGWQLVGGKWYYMNKSGAMQTGWQLVGGKWYYMNGSGAMQTGWQLVNGKWYYMNGSGAMQTGWQLVNGKWYYMNGSGAMQTGWQLVNGKWYYMNGSGAMQTGWQLVNGKWYYMYSDGAMAANTTINGYRVNADGAWIR